jgi:hypothetical protein
MGDRQGHFEEKTETGQGGGELAEPVDCFIRRGREEERPPRGIVTKIVQVRVEQQSVSD